MLYFLLGLGIGWWYYFWWGFQGNVGETPRLDITWQWKFCPIHLQKGKLYCFDLHVHHWMVCLVGLVSALWVDYPLILLGIWWVGFIHGLSYRDCWVFYK